MRVIAAALACTVMACATAGAPVAPGNHYTVFADAATADLTSQAAGAWQATGAVTLDVRQGECPGGAGVICVHLDANLGPDIGGRTVRQEATDSANVSVVAGMSAPVYEHELGHAMGLAHTGPETVMCHETGCMASGVTAADVAQFMSVRASSL